VTTDVAWVALGSNLGNRGQALARLRDLLTSDGVRLEAASSEILTRPIGVTGQGDFHNQLLKLRSSEPWSPQRWLVHTQAAELAAGRRHTYHWGPRRADVDILLLGEHGDIEYSDDNLTVPHAEISNRPFIGRLLGELEQEQRGEGTAASRREPPQQQGDPLGEAE
jgi:2-amino-4-hydroxy-6-hydroxymethyldihydropteridine diphosphokinase